VNCEHFGQASPSSIRQSGAALKAKDRLSASG
jgi:hypothetical protein